MLLRISIVCIISRPNYLFLAIQTHRIWLCGYWSWRMRAHSLMVAHVVMMSSTRIMTSPLTPLPDPLPRGEGVEEENELIMLVILCDLLRTLTWLVVRRDLYSSGVYGRSSDDAMDFASNSAWLYHLVTYLLIQCVGTAVIMICQGWSWICCMRSLVWMSVASLDHRSLATCLPLPYLRRCTRCLIIRS